MTRLTSDDGTMSILWAGRAMYRMVPVYVDYSYFPDFDFYCYLLLFKLRCRQNFCPWKQWQLQRLDKLGFRCRGAVCIEVALIDTTAC